VVWPKALSSFANLFCLGFEKLNALLMEYGALRIQAMGFKFYSMSYGMTEEFVGLGPKFSCMYRVKPFIVIPST
jgi:hypothetical protein